MCTMGMAWQCVAPLFCSWGPVPVAAILCLVGSPPPPRLHYCTLMISCGHDSMVAGDSSQAAAPLLGCLSFAYVDLSLAYVDFL